MHVMLTSKPGAPQVPNEDFVATRDKTVVVLDGVTTVPGQESGCRHGTVWFVQQLAAHVLEHAAEPTRGLAESLRMALADVVNLHGEECDLLRPDPPSATLAIVRQTADSLEYLVLCDCTVLVDVAGTVHSVTDDRLSRLEGPERQAVLADPTPTAYADMLEAKRHRRNRPGGYWVAAAEPHAATHALTGRFALHEVRRFAVMTDGVSRAVDRYGLTDWAGLLDALEAEGPAGTVHRIRQAERGDADTVRWPREKVHDDATVVYCQPDRQPADSRTART